MDMSDKTKVFPLESLLSARRLLAPQLVADRVFFISDINGMFSLYAMEKGGSIPEPLLPQGLALQNPHLMSGMSYRVFPELDKILVMIDQNGDENYQPCFIPINGGIPEPIFGEKFKGQKLMLFSYDPHTPIIYFSIDDRKTPDQESMQVDLRTLKTQSLGKSIYGNYVLGFTADHQLQILADQYTANDEVLFIKKTDKKDRQLLHGVPLDQRTKGETYPLLGLSEVHFIDNNSRLIFKTTLHQDLGGIGYLDLDTPDQIHPVDIKGLKHQGIGQLGDFEHVSGNRYVLSYNVDGVTWVYEAELQSKPLQIQVIRVIVGEAPLDQGVELGIDWYIDKNQNPPTIQYVAAFTTATEPSQLYLIPPASADQPVMKVSNERILGIPHEYLSPGEDASYNSFDGLRVSARLYLPSDALQISPPYPLVLYVHGGPQGQERPDFTWFSMPLIQFLTLNGFAVFVPNVRGSSGYGQEYMKKVDHDWGGNDRLDQIEGLKMLEKDSRIDSAHRAVIGRSYGGYMTLTLGLRHPDLWQAACPMFGPYNLITFIERLPETWKTYFYIAIGHPEKDKDFLLERSPITYVNQAKVPMLVVQGKNDPRVVPAESEDLVAQLKKQNVPVEYLFFEDEGHDVNKFKNQVTCYTRIVEFFSKYLKPTT